MKHISAVPDNESEMYMVARSQRDTYRRIDKSHSGLGKLTTRLACHIKSEGQQVAITTKIVFGDDRCMKGIGTNPATIVLIAEICTSTILPDISKKLKKRAMYQ